MTDETLRANSKYRKTLTVERLRHLLAYDPETGMFTWRQGRLHKNPHEGKRAGAVCGNGGIVIRVDYVMYHANRLAWFYVHGEWPSRFIDHKNGIRSDNRIANLREADDAQNQWNTKLSRANTSGFRGINYVKPTGKWRATIGHRGKYIFLGGFETKERAVQAYKDASRRLYGEFEREPE